jgi:5-formyltetrahydrofolate cyclo-ligase
VTDKKKLRTDIRKRREEFVKSQLNGSVVSSGLPDSLKSLFRSANVVAGYVKLGSEVDPSDLISAAVDMGRTIALPCLVGRATDLVFPSGSGDPMEQADFGFMQPCRQLRPVIRTILTPLGGFDRALNRLGQGWLL